MTLLFWTSMTLAGLLGVLALLFLAHDRASRAWDTHEARRRRRWEVELKTRRDTAS